MEKKVRRQYLKSSTFWSITPCSPLKVNWRFGKKYTASSRSKNMPSKKIAEPAIFTGFLLDSFFHPEDGCDIFL
jgi:hypothetical protein